MGFWSMEPLKREGNCSWGGALESSRACLIEVGRFLDDSGKMAFEVVERLGGGEWNYQQDANIDIFQEQSPPPAISVMCETSYID